jgi:hypothetical protein
VERIDPSEDSSRGRSLSNFTGLRQGGWSQRNAAGTRVEEAVGDGKEAVADAEVQIAIT